MKKRNLLAIAALGLSLGAVGTVGITNAINGIEAIEAADETTSEATTEVTGTLEAGGNLYLHINKGTWLNDSNVTITIQVDFYLSTESSSTNVKAQITFGTALAYSADDVELFHTLTADEVAAIAQCDSFRLKRMSDDLQTVHNDWNWPTTASPSSYNLYTIAGWKYEDNLHAWRKENTVYFQDYYNNWNAETICVYPFSSTNGNMFSSFTGWSLSDAVYHTQVTHFRSGSSNGTLYRVKFPTTYEKVVFNNGIASGDDAKKTGDLTVTSGNYYGSHDLTGDTGSASLGLAAEFVYQTEKAMGITTDGTTTYAGSICSFSETTVSYLKGLYEAMTEEPDTVFGSTVYTINPVSTSTYTNVAYSAIAAELYNLPRSSSGTVSAYIVNSLVDNNGLILAVSLASATLIAAAAFIVIKKKKEASVEE